MFYGYSSHVKMKDSEPQNPDASIVLHATVREHEKGETLKLLYECVCELVKEL